MPSGCLLSCARHRKMGRPISAWPVCPVSGQVNQKYGHNFWLTISFNFHKVLFPYPMSHMSVIGINRRSWYRWIGIHRHASYEFCSLQFSFIFPLSKIKKLLKCKLTLEASVQISYGWCRSLLPWEIETPCFLCFCGSHIPSLNLLTVGNCEMNELQAFPPWILIH